MRRFFLVLLVIGLCSKLTAHANAQTSDSQFLSPPVRQATQPITSPSSRQMSFGDEDDQNAAQNAARSALQSEEPQRLSQFDTRQIDPIKPDQLKGSFSPQMPNDLRGAARNEMLLPEPRSFDSHFASEDDQPINTVQSAPIRVRVQPEADPTTSPIAQDANRFGNPTAVASQPPAIVPQSFSNEVSIYAQGFGGAEANQPRNLTPRVDQNWQGTSESQMGASNRLPPAQLSYGDANNDSESMGPIRDNQVQPSQYESALNTTHGTSSQPIGNQNPTALQAATTLSTLPSTQPPEEAFLQRYQANQQAQPLPGAPLTIADALRQTPIQQRVEMAAEYWKTYYAWAKLVDNNDRMAQLQSLTKPNNNDDSLLYDTALNIAQGNVKTAEIELFKQQSALQTMLMGEDNNLLLPLPSDTPLTQKYETHFEWYAARHLVLPQHRMINDLLSRIHELFATQTKSIELSKTALEQIVRGARPQNMATTLVAIEQFYTAREDLLHSVVDYNQAICSYSLSIAQPNASPEQIAAMLIAPPTTVTQNVSTALASQPRSTSIGDAKNMATEFNTQGQQPTSQSVLQPVNSGQPAPPVNRLADVGFSQPRTGETEKQNLVPSASGPSGYGALPRSEPTEQLPQTKMSAANNSSFQSFQPSGDALPVRSFDTEQTPAANSPLLPKTPSENSQFTSPSAPGNQSPAGFDAYK